MNYRLTAADKSLPTRLGLSPWLRSQHPEEVGTCFIDSLNFHDGLALAYSHYLSPYYLLETNTLERGPSLTVAISLEGQASTISSNGQHFDFISGHSTIAAHATISGERRFPANQPIRQLRLIAERSLLCKYGLERLLGGVQGDQSNYPLYSGKYGSATKKLANSLIHLHDYGGSLLDIHIAALGLLSDQIRPFFPREEPVSALQSQDQELILLARDILISQFDHSLTIAYLCATVGTNEFKLKQGFRQMFGSSPHRMLTDIRMQKAWELLETGLHVTTVAYRVGYRHLSSFSAAFEKYYNRTPKSVVGSRNTLSRSFM